MTVNLINEILANPSIWILILGGFLAFLGGGLLRFFRQRGGPPAEPSKQPDIRIPEMKEYEDSMEKLRARKLFEQGSYDSAITQCYRESRRVLTDTLDVSDELTPWEFYRSCLDNELFEAEEDLRELTEAYEYAAFDPEPVTKEMAAKAMKTAQVLVKKHG